VNDRQDLEAKRLALERELAGLRNEVEQTVGWAPRAAWAAPLVGLAAGFSLAMSIGRRKRRRRLAPAKRSR